MSNVIELNDQNFDSVVVASETPVLVDFSATWCGPCRTLSPIIDKLAEEVGDSAKVCKVDVDLSPELANKFEIRSLPTIIAFKKGEVAGKLLGLSTKEKLVDLLK
jgi:thioredoxin 1